MAKEKRWHEASATVGTNGSPGEAIKNAHMDCLHQLIGRLGLNVNIETTTAVYVPWFAGEPPRERAGCVVVTMIGFIEVEKR